MFAVRVVRSGDPDLIGGGATQNRCAGMGFQSKRLVIVFLGDMNPCPGANATFFKKFKQFAIALIDAAYHVVVSWLRLGQ